MISKEVPFYRQHRRAVKEVLLIIGLLLFLLAYKTLSPVHRLVSLLVDPAVAGITMAYGAGSTLVHRLTGLNLGFVQEPPDHEFLFSVRLATYINERRAAPLLEIATDVRMPVDKRERALRALLLFESTADWIQPFLNELFKGGMLGLYDKQTPVLDELIKKLRAEGGVRQPLVRAYAEVVFSFMLQVPDAIVRQHTLRWVPDVLAEDALFMIIPRIDKEQDPEVQAAIEAALLNVRAVSDPETARSMLVGYYTKPPWPSLRFPLGVVLSRVGHTPANEYLAYVSRNENLSEGERLAVNLALSRTPFPRELKVTEREQKMMAKRESDRRQQVQAALDKRERMINQERMKRAMLARSVARRQAERRSEEDSREGPVPTRTERPAVEPPAPPRAEAERPAREESSADRRPPVSEERRPAPPPARETPAAEARAVDRAPAAPERRAAEPVAPAPAADEPPRPREEKPLAEARRPALAEPPAERVPPKPFSVPGELSPEERAEQARASKSKEVELARLPEDVLPPPLDAAPENKPKSLMNYVDVVFEVKEEAPIYQNPGERKATSASLPAGTKGKADFEVLIGEERWYQVKTKRGNGWVQGSRLAAFNLSPDDVVPAAPAAQQPRGDSMDAPRAESTYFEPTTEDVPVYAKPSEGAKVVNTLKMGTVYLAVKSEKVGPNRWFQLQLTSGEKGWVLGDINLQLANVLQPAQMRVPSQKPLSLRNKDSWFAAGWVTAGVKGVGVYDRKSIASQLLSTIDPGPVFRVIERSEGGGSEWYRIQFSGKKLGWVQAMDVRATKEPEK